MNNTRLVEGFTLLEVLVSIGIISVILSIGLIVGTNSLQTTFFKSEKTIILSMLEKARMRSMTNYYEVPHGICLDNSNPSKQKYVLFHSPYLETNPKNEHLPSNQAVNIVSLGDSFLCSNNGIIFDQLTGNSDMHSITLTENEKVSLININPTGRIDW